MTTMNFEFTERRQSFNFNLNDFKLLRRTILRLQYNHYNPLLVDKLVDLCDKFKDMKEGDTICFALYTYGTIHSKSIEDLNRKCGSLATIGGEYIANPSSGMRVKRTAKMWRLEMIDYDFIR